MLFPYLSVKDFFILVKVFFFILLNSTVLSFLTFEFWVIERPYPFRSVKAVFPSLILIVYGFMFGY